LQAFDYHSAETVEDLISTLANGNGGARILCGGTDLLIQLREGRVKARLVVDVKNIPELNEISLDTQGNLRLGAAVSCFLASHNPHIQTKYPGLVDAIQLIGGIQIQNRASLGGNLCNASPAADSIPAMIVHHAVCEVVGPAGMREIAVEDFCIAPGRTILKSGEFLVALRFPSPVAHFSASYLRFIPRNEMDIAVVGAGAGIVLDDGKAHIVSARIALGAVAPTPLLVEEAGEYLRGKPVNAEVIEQAARIAQEAARPINDLRGTIAQRKQLSRVLTRRALEKAIQRAGGNIL
jgi:carbon-monoxide dehydrogenase medium subunit